MAQVLKITRGDAQIGEAPQERIGGVDMTARVSPVSASTVEGDLPNPPRSGRDIGVAEAVDSGGAQVTGHIVEARTQKANELGTGSVVIDRTGEQTRPAPLPTRRGDCRPIGVP